MGTFYSLSVISNFSNDVPLGKWLSVTDKIHVLMYSHRYVNNCTLHQFHQKKEGKPSETDSVKFKISSKTPRGKKDITKRHHHRHHKRQPGEQQFPMHVVTGKSNI